ncbi:methyltransferase domain-containing protein [Nonomuraea pusilla]|uniref:Methyltransferase domain-containing protein n=1 Tax=Nonomuraea pusilla TaxID=46177 RepID=A0A1H7F8P2_9ACTN|nr:class I SAM-dependent methyltransferase [Nonomuraea pusilla]SEK22493.1 Methyltransferase domain-containing protein [Nonomuraea pusilla]
MTATAVAASPLDRLAAVLACPSCHGPLDGGYACLPCGVRGDRRGGQLRFGGFHEAETRDDPLNRMKETVKRRFGRVYPLAIQVVSPVLLRRFVRPFLAGFDLDRELVADLGCGTNRYDPRLLCVDGSAYANVDLVSDLRALPLGDATLDGLVSVAVLEHVPDPQAHVREMWRVLKPGGRLVCYVPFMQPFHASPYDYQRYTRPGMERLFADFAAVDVRTGAGPTSAMLWVVQEWLALLLSCGSSRLYRLLTPLMWLLSPLKLLDVLLARHPDAAVVASGFVVEARKA